MEANCTVVVPHAYTAKWLQILVTSLKECKNDHKFKIMILDNSPDDNYSIRALTESSLGEGVRVVRPPKDSQWHAGSLDYAIDLIDTPYYFATETDCRAVSNGWLDWYFDKMPDEHTAMVGWFWEVPGGKSPDRLYINSSATLYRTDILRRLRAETLRNDNFMICYGTGLKRRMWLQDRLIECWKQKHWGPFQEVRGYQEVFHKVG